MIQSSEHMVHPTVSRHSGRSCWQQWWRRSPNRCFSKRILLLLVWEGLFSFSWGLLKIYALKFLRVNLRTSQVVSSLLAPFVGWLADFKIGRYEIIRFGSIISFSASIFCYFALFTEGVSGSVLFMAAFVLVSLGDTCFSAALLPFLSDQLIGATSDELSAAVQWYMWANSFGFSLSTIISFLVIDTCTNPDDFSCKVSLSNVKVAGIYAVPLALIIISDCLCLQWLDRTHKVTNPIKLIIQVLNYTRKHRYPERRSAFTYLDEEQPSRMDFGKQKFGGPFTEEEVEDVKTFLRLIPLIVCFVLCDSIARNVQIDLLKPDDNSWIIDVVNFGMTSWVYPLILVPFYRLLLYYVFHKHIPSMLKCIAAGLLMTLVGFILLDAVELGSVFEYDDIQRYLSCTQLNVTVQPDDYVDWYWKLGPFLLYGTGKVLAAVSFFVFLIAQSPEKMKGLAVGLTLAVQDAALVILSFSDSFVFTLCFDILHVVPLVVLFAIFLLLTKWYTLRERNREINIQAIVEEHYERYMDQEEEYLREHGTNSFFDSDAVYSDDN